MRQGRIVKAVAGFYYVADSETDVIYDCRARGLFKKQGVNPLVGDWVLLEQDENGNTGTIVDVLPRIVALTRPPIANVNRVLVVFSLSQPELSLRLLDRMLVHVEKEEVEPIICLTKIDAVDDLDAIRVQMEPYEQIGYPVLFLSTRTGHGVASLKEHMAGNVNVVSGQSGVGKSSLINALAPDLQLSMGKVSERLGRGKHTTRHVELVRIAERTFVADTPGFSQLDWKGMEPEQLADFFRDIVTLRSKCYYRSCLHEEEPDCAVRIAANDGRMALSRYQHYREFLQEVKEVWQRRY